MTGMIREVASRTNVRFITGFSVFFLGTTIFTPDMWHMWLGLYLMFVGVHLMPWSKDNNGNDAG